jgi:excisionase family DNA binding protein
MKQEKPKLLRISKAAYELGLSTKTVRRWVKQEKIQAVWVGKEARIPRSEIERFVGTTQSRFLILYGRVSGQGQKADLKTQLNRLQAWALTERPEQKEHTLILFDIGSGLKASRKNLQKLLKLVVEDHVSEVVVTYADRLTRFGLEYLQTLFTSFRVTFTVLESDATKTSEQELTDDLLAIITAFSGRLYGMRSHKQKELVKCAQTVLNALETSLHPFGREEEMMVSQRKTEL